MCSSRHPLSSTLPGLDPGLEIVFQTAPARARAVPDLKNGEGPYLPSVYSAPKALGLDSEELGNLGQSQEFGGRFHLAPPSWAAGGLLFEPRGRPVFFFSIAPIAPLGQFSEEVVVVSGFSG